MLRIRVSSLLVAVCMLTPFVFAQAAEQTLHINKVEGDKEDLVFQVLKLALSKSAPNTQYEHHSESLNEAQLVVEVESGSLDVMWAGAAKDKDERLLAIRIPILKGLLGHRIFIINREDQDKFAQIKTFAELQQLEAGQGRFWGDTAILKSAHIPTITTIKYDNLFPMLEGKRFDYFPRALHEPFIEVDAHKDLDLVVDKNIMLVYPHAMHFYVNKNNKRLYNLIYTGFEKAIEDGSFDALFFNHPMIKDVLEKADLAHRTVFRVDNPALHPDTPTDRKEFWLDVSKL